MKRSNAFPWDTSHTLLARKMSATHTAAEVAEALGCGLTTLYKYSRQYDISYQKRGEKHHNSTRSDEDVELARQLHEAGVGIADISEKLEMPVKYVDHVVCYRFR